MLVVTYSYCELIPQHDRHFQQTFKSHGVLLNIFDVSLQLEMNSQPRKNCGDDDAENAKSKGKKCLLLSWLNLNSKGFVLQILINLISSLFVFKNFSLTRQYTKINQEIFRILAYKHSRDTFINSFFIKRQNNPMNRKQGIFTKYCYTNEFHSNIYFAKNKKVKIGQYIT